MKSAGYLTSSCCAVPCVLASGVRKLSGAGKLCPPGSLIAGCTATPVPLGQWGSQGMQCLVSQDVGGSEEGSVVQTVKRLRYESSVTLTTSGLGRNCTT